ncbi:MAG: hypothetical protein ACI92S_001851, partial [Planctomycetaceae bacterium]
SRSDLERSRDRRVIQDPHFKFDWFSGCRGNTSWIERRSCNDASTDFLTESGSVSPSLGP